LENKQRLLLNIEELSEWLGIPVWQIRNLVRQHKMPVTRIDRRLRFKRDSIEEWLKKNEQNPIEEG
jgi:excisionase family DNA binding protein